MPTYTRENTVDPNLGGDSVKIAILKVDDDVTNLYTDLNDLDTKKAIKAGDTYTGIHNFTAATTTVATAAADTDTTQAASTAFAKKEADDAQAYSIQRANHTGTQAQNTVDSLVSDLSNKVPLAYLDTDGTLTSNSDVKVATQKAAKTYSDTKIPLAYLDSDTTLAADSDTKIATQKATKALVAATAFSTALPTQAGSNGKLVTTDGSAASWTEIKTVGGTTLLGSGDALPDQTGNNGLFLSTNGTSLSWAGIGVFRSGRTSNTILVSADKGKLIDITSGTFTQTFTAAATLGDGWHCYLRNSGTGGITLYPDGTETIDGLTTFIMYPGETRLIQCTGTTFFSIVLQGFSHIFTSTGTFIKPPGYSRFGGYLWGGGGGGGRSDSLTYASGGGGGGACVPVDVLASALSATTTVTIGAGGTGATANAGGAGGTSTFSTFSVYGGGQGMGASNNNYHGASGGGALSKGSSSSLSANSYGGFPGGSTSLTGAYGLLGGGFGGGGSNDGDKMGPSAFGGAGGGGSQSASATSGSQSMYGGGGGGAGWTTPGAGGGSYAGGAGGAGASSTDGAAGTQPAGGGGGTQTGTSSGAGGAGQLTIWGVI